MESDKHYFIEGLFVIVLSVAVALFFVWLSRPGNKDDVLYRIHFAESVSGLKAGSQPSMILRSLAVMGFFCSAGICALRMEFSRSPLFARLTSVFAIGAGSITVGRKALIPVSVEAAA